MKLITALLIGLILVPILGAQSVSPAPTFAKSIGEIRTPSMPLDPPAQGGDDAETTIRSQFNNLVSVLIGWGTIIGALFFMVQLILGGYNFMTAGGDTSKMADGRQRILNGLIGLIIIVSAYAIVGLVANMLGISIFNPLVDALFLNQT